MNRYIKSMVCLLLCTVLIVAMTSKDDAHAKVSYKYTGEFLYGKTPNHWLNQYQKWNKGTYNQSYMDYRFFQIGNENFWVINGYVCSFITNKKVTRTSKELGVRNIRIHKGKVVVGGKYRTGIAGIRTISTKKLSNVTYYGLKKGRIVYKADTRNGGNKPFPERLKRPSD